MVALLLLKKAFVLKKAPKKIVKKSRALIAKKVYVSTLAGGGTPGYVDGPGTSAKFHWPEDVAVDSAGNVYVVDHWNHCIRKIDSKGNVSIFAGNRRFAENGKWYADGQGTSASFYLPHGIAVDNTGNVYGADYGNHCIRKIDSKGYVSTLAGSGPIGKDAGGYADGPGTSARFDYLEGITVDNTGNVYVADRYNHRIRKIDSKGYVSTLAGSGPTGKDAGGYADGPGISARFNQPVGVAVDNAGNVYVTDEYNHRIRKIDTKRNVSTLAGSGPTGGVGEYADGPGTSARFYLPWGIAVDNTGNVYVADSFNHCIRKIDRKGNVSTLAGHGTGWYEAGGYADGRGISARFNNPRGIAIDNAGNLYVADYWNHCIRKITYAPIKVSADLKKTPEKIPEKASAVFVQIEGGTFMMGSPSSEPERIDIEVQRRVTVSSFYMSNYQLTQREYEEVMGNNPSTFKGDNLPVENVSWYDAIEYCNKRSIKEDLTPAYTIDKNRRDPNNKNSRDRVEWLVTWNKKANGYRLPTEAEWEYACRAGTTTPFNTGNNITSEQANYYGHYPYNNNNAQGICRETTTPVGSFAPNAWGLYDMHGNVWEWCWDWLGGYKTAAQTDPTGAVSGSSRVIRGGSWCDYARDLRSAGLGGNAPDWSGHAGIRPVRSSILRQDKSVQSTFEQTRISNDFVQIKDDTSAQTRISNDFVPIEGGTFMMGSPASETDRGDSETQHRVTVSAFYMSKYQVMQSEYEDVMESNPSYFKGANLPVERVSWFDTITYCNKRSIREGFTPAYTINGENVTWDRNANGYRLPTETEWEYACRAGTTTPFNTGNNITTDQANYKGTLPYNNNAEGIFREKTTPVGSFAPNAWGLYDMHGNVLEWCWDWDEEFSLLGGGHIVRGGSWNFPALTLRSAYRDGLSSGYWDNHIGFRLVRS